MLLLPVVPKLQASLNPCESRLGCSDKEHQNTDSICPCLSRAITTYTLLNPSFTGEPDTDGLDGIVPSVITATATGTTTATATAVLTVTVTYTAASSSPYSSAPHLTDLLVNIQKRDATTVTIYGGYGNPQMSTGTVTHFTTTTTTSATTTATVPMDSTSSASSESWGSDSSYSSSSSSSSSGSVLSTSFSSSSGFSPSSSYGSTSGSSVLSTPSSSVASSGLPSLKTTLSGLTIPAESETAPMPPRPSVTHTYSAGGRSIPEVMTTTVLGTALLSATLAWMIV